MLRQQMMYRVGLEESDHEANIEDFLLEEIELANAYFVGATVRSYATQLIGMSARHRSRSRRRGALARQIEGWRRIGLEEDAMTYLLEHTGRRRGARRGLDAGGRPANSRGPPRGGAGDNRRGATAA